LARKEALLSSKDKEIAALKAALKQKDEELHAKDAEIAAQEDEIAALKEVLKNQITYKDEEIAGLKAVLENSHAEVPRSPTMELMMSKSKSFAVEPVVEEDSLDDTRDELENDTGTLHIVASTE